MRRVYLVLQRVALIGSEVNGSSVFVEPVQPEDVKIAVGDLALELGVGGERILRVEAI